LVFGAPGLLPGCPGAGKMFRAPGAALGPGADAGQPPPHVSPGAPADVEKGSDDGDSRARSTEDSIEVSSHVDAILEYDFNYPHDLGQVFASDLPSIAGVPSSEGVCPEAVVAAFDGGRGVCKNYSQMTSSKAKKE
jgi:hypothetical protein